MTENSNIFSMFELEYPKLGAALVEAAVMGYGVIAYDQGNFLLVWWEGDESITLPLSSWEQNNFDFQLESEVA